MEYLDDSIIIPFGLCFKEFAGNAGEFMDFCAAMRYNDGRQNDRGA